MTDHTAHIEECERVKGVAFRNWNVAVCKLGLDPNAGAQESRAWGIYERSKESAIRAHLHEAIALGTAADCPVEACEDGHILLERLTDPPENVTEYCEYCDGRGMVLPAKAEAYEGD